MVDPGSAPFLSSAPPTSGLVDHALGLARRGLAVFPLKPRSKEPATPHGFKDATTDPATIAKWWNANPNYNIAVATGAVSGVFVIDVDGGEGEASLRRLIARYGPLPASIESITGGGGRHIWLKYAPGLGCTAKRLGPGLDTRGDGGYVVAPPSIHPSGRRYEWAV